MTMMANDLQREVSKTPLPSDNDVQVLPANPSIDQKALTTDATKSVDIASPTVPEDVEDRHAQLRPPIVYDSAGSFFTSVARRFKSLWTRRFILSLLAGQLLSLCITSTSVMTTELTMRGFNISTTQTWFLYCSLFLAYTPYTIYQYGFKGWAKMVWNDGWKYTILAATDVEANFMVVKAFQNTNILSCMLLDTWAIPVCMFFTWVYFRSKFHWSQYLGIFICILGMGLLVYSDQTHNFPDGPGKSMIKGDLLMLAGATLYGFTNATEEFFVRKAPLYQVVGQLGMWGVLINGIQAAALEHEGIRTAPWNARNVGYLIIYTLAMFILYTVAPILYRLASSTYFNLSILSSDFYGLVIGIFVFKLKTYWLYFPAFAIIVSGLVIYFWHTAPEEGWVDAVPPPYVQTRSARRQQKDMERANN